MRCEHDHGCITCGDEALPLEVLRVDAMRGLALRADADGRTEMVEVALVDRADPGDRLLVHAGTALLRLDDRERPEAGRLHRAEPPDAPSRGPR